eukprot:5180637-Prymnesium_polylepis.1
MRTYRDIPERRLLLQHELRQRVGRVHRTAQAACTGECALDSTRHSGHFDILQPTTPQVHEADAGKGGAPLEVLRGNCHHDKVAYSMCLTTARSSHMAPGERGDCWVTREGSGHTAYRPLAHR